MYDYYELPLIAITTFLMCFKATNPHEIYWYLEKTNFLDFANSRAWPFSVSYRIMILYIGPR